MNVDKNDMKFLSSAAVLYSKQPQQPAVAAAALLGLLVAGTGGIFTPINTAVISEWTKVPAVTVRNSIRSKTTEIKREFSIPAAIAEVRERLGLTMSELASIFGVSRQAVYLWLKGDNLKSEYVQRIWHISLVANRLSTLGISKPEHFIHRPLTADGKSLFQLLINGDDVNSALPLLKSQWDLDQSARDKVTNTPDTSSRAYSYPPNLVWTSPVLDEING